MFAGVWNHRNSENNLPTLITFTSPCISVLYHRTTTATPHRLEEGWRRVRTGQNEPVASFKGLLLILGPTPHWNHLGSFKKKLTGPGSHPMELGWGAAWVSEFLKILIHSRVKNWCRKVSLPVRCEPGHIKERMVI